MYKLSCFIKMLQDSEENPAVMFIPQMIKPKCSLSLPKVTLKTCKEFVIAHRDSLKPRKLLAFFIVISLLFSSHISKNLSHITRIRVILHLENIF